MFRTEMLGAGTTTPVSVRPSQGASLGPIRWGEAALILGGGASGLLETVGSAPLDRFGDAAFGANTSYSGYTASVTNSWRFFICLYREGPPRGKRPSDVDQWRGTVVGAPKTADAVRGGPGAWQFLPGQLDVTVPEHLGPDSIWCLYDRIDARVPKSYDYIGRNLKPGEVFTVPLGPGYVANLEPGEEDRPSRSATE